MFKTKTTFAAVLITLVSAVLFAFLILEPLPAPAQDRDKVITKGITSMLADTTVIKLDIIRIDSLLARHQQEMKTLRLKRNTANALMRYLRKLAD